MFKKPFVLAIFCISLLLPTAAALAFGPVLSLSNSGDNVSINISSAPSNSQIQLSYTQPGSSLPTTINNFGATDFSGNFSTTVSSSGYGLSSGSQVYVTVGGQQSNSVAFGSNNGYGGCGTYGCGSGSFPLSRTNVNLNVGQTDSITAYNYSGSIYISNNSSPAVVSATVSGSQVILNGLTNGSSNVSVCNNTGQCSTVYVTVSGSNCYAGAYCGSLSLSQTNVNLNIGQTSYVTVNNFSGSVYISSNSNSSAVSASVSGSQISLFGLNSGSSNVSVCVSGSQCASVYVTVGNGGCGIYGCSSGSLSLSQTNLNLSVGQTSLVSANNAAGGSLYISSNSNSSVVSATVSGNQVNFYALAGGYSTVSICANNSSQCGNVNVTVGGVLGATTGAVMISDDFFTPRIQTVPIGTNVVWTNRGSMNHTVTADDNSFNSGTLLPGATFARVFNTPGTYFYHCIFHGGVNGVGMSGQIIVTGSGGYGGYGSLSLSPTSLNLNLGQSATVTGYNTAGGSALAVTSNSNPVVANASATGNTVYVYGTGVGYTTMNICSNSGYGCASLYVTVGGANGGGNTLSLSQSSVYLSAGQSTTVIANNTSGYILNIASNSNPSAVYASVSGYIVNLNGLTSGTSNIVVCSNYINNCGTVYVTVAGGANNSNVYINPASLNLSSGQTATVTLYGPYNYSFYLFSNSNPYVANIGFQNNIGTISAIGQGFTSMSICQNNTSQCAALTVNVNSTTNGYSGTGGGLTYPGAGGSVLGTSTFTNGQLISENGTVYIVYKNTKSGFTNAASFVGLGYRFNNVVLVSNSGLTNSGFAINSSNIAHPWGSWIKSGNRIYFVYEQGLIPVPNNAVFLNNGGGNIATVPANRLDFNKPILSAMVNNDSRAQ